MSAATAPDGGTITDITSSNPLIADTDGSATAHGLAPGRVALTATANFGGSNCDSAPLQLDVYQIRTAFFGLSPSLVDARLVVVSSPSMPNRPYTPVRFIMDGPDGLQVPFAVTYLPTPARVSISQPFPMVLTANTPFDTQLYASAASASPTDRNAVIVREGDANGPPVGGDQVISITGIKIKYSGTFSFATDNNDGHHAKSRAAVLGYTWPQGPYTTADLGPLVWETTPLPIEELGGTNHRVIIQEGVAPTRWPLTGGKRGRIAVEIIAVKTFGPTIDLSGRDPALTAETDVWSPTVVTAPAGKTEMGLLLSDDTDRDPTTPPDSDGYEAGVEQFVTFGVRLGSALEVNYTAPDNGALRARIWTRFTGTPDPAGDLAAIGTTFLPGGAVGPTSPNFGVPPDMYYFDDTGTLVNGGPQTLKELFLRNVGFRSQVKGAWANWTSRHLAAATGTTDSFIARLFVAAVAAHPDAEGRAQAEGYAQFADYDWYTLMGSISNGVLSTPSGIAPTFKEWPGVVPGMPTPFQPDVEKSADPYAGP